MKNTGSFVYFDLFARLVPGTILLALVKLTNLTIPKPWKEVMSGLGPAQPVLVPILFIGLAYVVGMALEVLLSAVLGRFNILAFSSALTKYTPIYAASKAVKQGTPRPARELARASSGYLLSAPLDNEKPAILYISRFYTESKMCFSLVIVLFAFIALSIANNFLYHPIMMNIDHIFPWLLIMLLAIPILLYIAYQRLQNRAWFILRTIERSATEQECEANKMLRDELLTYCNL